MSGRMTLGSLFVLAALIPGICHAQGGYGYAPPGGQPTPQQYGYCPPPPAPSNTIYEQLPDDLGFLHEDSPLDRALTNVFRHSYYRAEYLLWSGTRPGNVLLGATPASGFIPSTTAIPVPPNTFNIASNPITGNPATAIEPSLAAFDVKNMNGFKGTIGLPIGPGAIELSAFVLGNRQNRFDGTSLIRPEVPANLLSTPPIPIAIPGNFIGQPINVGGVQTFMVYDSGYQAIMKTGIYGGEANYIFDAPNKGTGDLLTFSPLIGFRYLNYRESLYQGGGYSFITDATTNPVTTSPQGRQIFSESNNNSYGAQFGVRAEATLSKVTFGAEPKIMLGLNSYTASLSTINVPFDNPASNTSFNFHKAATVFSPIADLRLYTRINISQRMNVYAAYNLMYVGSISRPYDSIGYNITAGGNGLFTPSFTDTIIQGLSLGGELQF
ncbi:MAG: hypothetical protein JWP89_4348 [Schlesneria sp.]|nr:hypothetical protein [Schlesneria sp.]